MALHEDKRADFFYRFFDRGRHLWFGVALIAVFWPFNWFLPGLRTHILFFPLWLGYVLVVDALVLRRRGSSLLTRAGSLGRYGMLFVISAVAWWVFELINERTNNWHYQGAEQIGPLVYAVFSTLSFSTVIPAVFGTAELLRSFSWVERLRPGPRIRPTQRTCWTLLFFGLLMFGLLLAWPRIFYPLVWGALYCTLEPINVWLGNRSLLDYLGRGDWRPLVSLSLGALVCGFFWEMWNYYSFPKWTYSTPGVEFLHVFEMPLLGFIGYLPFALELYAFYQLLEWRELEVNL